MNEGVHIFVSLSTGIPSFWLKYDSPPGCVWSNVTTCLGHCPKDKDGDHTITEEEFAERCLQLHGPARSADLFALKLGTVTWWNLKSPWLSLHSLIWLISWNIRPLQKNCVVIKLAPLINCFFDVLAYFWHVSLCFSMVFFLNWFSNLRPLLVDSDSMALRTLRPSSRSSYNRSGRHSNGWSSKSSPWIPPRSPRRIPRRIVAVVSLYSPRGVGFWYPPGNESHIPNPKALVDHDVLIFEFFLRWDILVPWRVCSVSICLSARGRARIRGTQNCGEHKECGFA